MLGLLVLLSVGRKPKGLLSLRMSIQRGLIRVDSGLGLAFYRLGQKLNVKRGVRAGHEFVDACIDLFGVDHLGVAFLAANASIKIPKVKACGHRFFGLASHILFDVVFDALQESIGVFALDVELVSFFHPLY